MRAVVAAPGEIAASRRRAGGGTPTVLGYSTKGASTAGIASNRIQVSQFTLASAGTLNELHGWFVGGASAVHVRVVIYAADGGGGLPGTRLAYTADTTLPATVDTHLTETGFSVALAAANYWLGWVSPGPSGPMVYIEDLGGTHQQRTDVGVTFNPPPDPFGTPNASGTRKLSCWGVVLV